MKFRFIVLAFLISLALASCSLAEDITPPAGSSAPTSISTTIPITQTPEPPATTTPKPPTQQSSETADITASSTASSTDSAIPTVELSPTSQPVLVTIDGTVSVSSGTPLPSGVNATLLVYNVTAGQVMQTLEAPIQSDGKYVFTNVPADTSTLYLVTMEYNGVTYDSVPVQFDGTLLQINMPVTVYDTTEDLNVLSITQAHLQFDFSTAGQIQVMALYIISNPGSNSVIVTSDGTTIPFIQIPELANPDSVKYQLAQSSSPLMMATNGFAFLPGSDKQYGIITTFTVPYTNRLILSQPFSLPVSSATIIVPEGVKVRSDQLTDAGTQASTGTTAVTYHLYQSGSLATGSTLSLTISGMPGDKPGFVLDNRTWLMIGIAALGLALIGLGIFLFLRDRRFRKMEEEFEIEEENGDKDALGTNRESIMDAIIALDDQYKAGDISKEAYENRRDELKRRLKNLA
jgi:hypothetical protein